MQALRERRLTLVVEADGNIKRVSLADSNVFGFDPDILLGKRISSVIDCLQPSRLDDLDMSEDEAMSNIIMELAKRCVELEHLKCTLH